MVLAEELPWFFVGSPNSHKRYLTPFFLRVQIVNVHGRGRTTHEIGVNG